MIGVSEILISNLTKEKVFFDEPMNKHTSFRTGGKADIFVTPTTYDEINFVINLCKERQVLFFVMGNGSNLLVTDKGYRGIIIKICKNLNSVSVNENVIITQGGAMLSTVAKIAMENSLSGMEFASGIPGTIGGAIAMNAGAYGNEMKDIVKEITVIKNGKIIKISNEDAKFEYRNSEILKERIVVLDVTLILKNGDKDSIKKEMKDINTKRREKQPLEYPSAGSTFKRPLNNFAGKLIMDAGLAGITVGGACVSKKHCGFIINENNATSSDILELIEIVYNTVLQKFNISLEKEVRVIGEL